MNTGTEGGVWSAGFPGLDGIPTMKPGIGIWSVCARLFATPIDCSPPSSSVHGIFQAKLLDWVATSYPRGSSRSWNWSISCIGRLILYHWTTREALWYMRGTPKLIYTRPPWNRQSEMETDGASALVVWKENPLSCAWPQQPRQGLRS